MQNLNLILGPPGTGKTTRLIRMLGESFAAGRRPGDIAFVSFTRTAIAEIQERLVKQFPAVTKSPPWFKTIHGMGVTLLRSAGGLGGLNLMGSGDMRRFAKEFGYQISDEAAGDPDEADDDDEDEAEDDGLVRALAWSRSRLKTLEDAAAALDCDGSRLLQFKADLWEFKASNRLFDFTDMIEKALAKGMRPPVKVAFVDEAQDLSPLQQKAVEYWFAKCDEVTVAGDDDQAIFTFQGSEPQWLMDLHSRAKVEVLSQSYRLPAQVHGLAKQLISRNTNRLPKAYRARPDEGRVYEFDNCPGSIATARAYLEADPSRTAFILTRTNRMLQSWAALLLGEGLTYGLFNVKNRHVPNLSAVVHAFQRWGTLEAGGVLKGDDEINQLLRYTTVTFRVRMDLIQAGKVDRESLAFAAPKFVLAADRDPFALIARAGKLIVESIRGVDGFPGALLAPARFKLGTMHSAKGSEAAVVVVSADWSARAAGEMATDEGREGENRLAYVAVTRAKEALVLCTVHDKHEFDFLTVNP